jgi:hypothetical protein
LLFPLVRGSVPGVTQQTPRLTSLSPRLRPAGSHRSEAADSGHGRERMGGAYEWPITETLEQRFTAKVRDGEVEECTVWLASRNPAGYGMIRNGRRMALAHRVAWVLANGEIPVGLHVLHHCDNPACCNIRHLYLGTNDDNIADKVARGRSHSPQPKKRGDGHPLAKLTTADVLRIRAATGIPGEGKRLAEELGVTKSAICHIQKRKIWKHV